MSMPRYGIAFRQPDAAATLAAIQQAETLDVPGVWLVTGVGSDALTIFAAAAAVTSRIQMGTAIVPTFPRHPLVMAQQAADIATMAPGRLTLGVGPSHGPIMERQYGIPYVRPLEHLREYVTIVKTLLASGSVDFKGERYTVRSRLEPAPAVPVIISALREASFELAGAVADGAVSWNCPAPYLHEVALPAMQRGAQQAGRTTPPLVGHAFLTVTEDADAVMAAAGVALQRYPQLPNYAQMFAAAGYPEALEGAWSQRMLDAMVLHGNEETVRQRVEEFMSVSGADHLILYFLATGKEEQTEFERSLRLVATL